MPASHLGLLSDAAACAKKMRSLSIRTANGHCVSILNDDHNNDINTGASSTVNGSRCSSIGARSVDHYQQSLPDMTPDRSPFFAHLAYTPFTHPSTPQMSPARLPSMSALIQAVKMSGYSDKTPALPSFSQVCSHNHAAKNQPMPSLPITTCTQIALRSSSSKRRYVCSHSDCGKAFTTSGHLSRHYRIHTGEKNYQCLYPGCCSRFSRQDNMMQHYRTHLSLRSRRTRGRIVSAQYQGLGADNGSRQDMVARHSS
ncbi:transcriptional repressor, partial [Kickxella alabastrina]